MGEAQGQWNLRLHGGSAAKLLLPADVPERMRVEVEKAVKSAPAWQIQLWRLAPSLRAQRKYTLTFRARSDRPRSITLGVTEAHPPWSGRGLRREIQIGRQWQSFSESFEASHDEPEVRVHFDLGGSRISVELEHVALRAGGWHFNVGEDNEAQLVFPTEDEQRVRVSIAKAGTPTPRHIQLLRRGFSLEAKRGHAVTLRARADRPRSLILGVAQSQPPWDGLGLHRELSLVPEWRSFFEPFEASGGAEDAHVYLDLGGSGIPAEFENVALVPSDWRFAVQPGSAAGLETPSGADGPLRVAIREASTPSGGDIQLMRRGFSLQARRGYVVTLRARADEPRSVTLGVAEAHPPWSGLGLRREIQLDRQWQSFSESFEASHDEPEAHVYIDLGGSRISVELEDVALRAGGWHFNVKEDNEAQLMFPTEDEERARVSIAKAGTPTPRHIQLLRRGFSLEAKRGHAVTLRARADRPRSLILGVAQSQPPWNGLGLHRELSLLREWRSFFEPFEASGDAEDAHVYLNLGGSGVPAEFENVALVPSDWRFAVQPGSAARLEAPSGAGGPLRVAIEEAGTPSARDIQLTRRGFSLEAGRGYVVTLRARADRTRRVALGVAQQRPPGTGLGLYRELELGTDWQTFSELFEASADEPNAQVHVDLGGNRIPAEFDDLTLRPSDWQFSVQEGSVARVAFAPDGREELRVEIEKADAEAGDVQLGRRCAAVRARDRYVLGFRARADQRRSIVVGVSQGRSPWEGVGLFRSLGLVPEWQSFEMDFEAIANTPAALIHFDLGGSSVSTELADVHFERVA